MKPLRMNRTILAGLKESLSKLEDLTDLERKSTCAVPMEHRKGVERYVSTWALAPLRDAIARIEGRMESSKRGPGRRSE